jgi:hypothetical protein
LIEASLIPPDNLNSISAVCIARFENKPVAQSLFSRARDVQVRDKSKTIAFKLLAAALIVGGFLRFFRLGRADLTPDEAASWAAASARSVAEVVRLQATLNPGKLAVHDIALHAWIGAFGASVTAMRALSAALGTFQILLVFWAAREVLLLAVNGRNFTADNEEAADSCAALCAFIFAVNLVAIKYAREARMYALLMVMVLAQVAFLLRSVRREVLLNYSALAFFTALSVATNFTAVFVIITEALWLLFLSGAAWAAVRWKTLGAIAVGMLLFLAMTAGTIHNGITTLDNGVLNFIPYPSLWDLVSFFDYSTLSYIVIGALALWGVMAGWARARDSIVFALLWMWAPVLLLYLVSLTITPLLVTRYALSSFVPFLILAALGIWYCGSARIQLAALLLITAISMVQFVSYVHRSPSRIWQHGLQQIMASRPSGVIAVAPARGANLIRYYLNGESGYRVVGLTDNTSCAQSALLVVWNGGMYGPYKKQAQECSAAFPHLLYRYRDFTVLAR